MPLQIDWCFSKQKKKPARPYGISQLVDSIHLEKGKLGSIITLHLPSRQRLKLLPKEAQVLGAYLLELAEHCEKEAKAQNQAKLA